MNFTPSVFSAAARSTGPPGSGSTFAALDKTEILRALIQPKRTPRMYALNWVSSVFITMIAGAIAANTSQP
ncbi:hypothetical protein CW354_06065 [Marinicaulis flavus]|uniref:Uncharacterized protein n=1 Tax=Hyphococcus luteus TaxID=2058213 RepID=A0A2S7K5Z7_9PROT|nr:hypothetical protein CW354_06065 [Marinicaulis flavus]